MRKFLIVLMIVAMATFLFVGCKGVTPPIENNPPEIISSAITSGKVGVVYNYDVNAIDPEGDTLTYSLTEKPFGMSIVPTTGLIWWTPTDAGVFGVGVKVSDPDGLFDVQGFNITVVKADEPEPEPELVLVGITVDPKTIELVKGRSETIVVTACYEFRSYGVILDPKECLFLTNNSKVATVDEDGLVEAVGEGTADILVSYKNKIATLEVTVTYLPVEIKVDMPLFEVGIEKGFRLETVANDDIGKNVLVYFTLPTEAEVYYWEVEEPGSWKPLPVEPVEVAFGPPGGFKLVDNITNFFKATFNKVGIYETTLEVWTVTGTKPDEVKVEKLCSKVIIATVVLAPPPINEL